jgi:hypothetical protein
VLRHENQALRRQVRGPQRDHVEPRRHGLDQRASPRRMATGQTACPNN